MAVRSARGMRRLSRRGDEARPRVEFVPYHYRALCALKTWWEHTTTAYTNGNTAIFSTLGFRMSHSPNPVAQQQVAHLLASANKLLRARRPVDAIAPLREAALLEPFNPII